MRREWTEWEEQYLKKRYLSQPVEKTAKKLNRTETSVRRKAARMRLNHYTDELNAKTLAKCFNSDLSVVVRWIEKFDLPCKIVECKTQTRYVIQMDNFWTWAKQHKDVINWSKYNSCSLHPEPVWLRNEVLNYKTPNSRKRFTDEEIRNVKWLLKRGLTYKEIAEETSRSYNSINHLCRKIYAR